MCVWSAGLRKKLRSSPEVATKRNTPSVQMVKAVFALFVSIPLLAAVLQGAIDGFQDLWLR